MEPCEKKLRKASWDYIQTSDGRHYRFTEVDGMLVSQKRVIFPENSKRRMSLKALAGDYLLMDMKITGAGNSYLIIGWETVPSMASSLIEVAQ
jgi:hypothetical protein